LNFIMSDRFFIDFSLHLNQKYLFSSEEAHHLKKVMRVPSGSCIQVINGKGSLAEGLVKFLEGGVEFEVKQLLQQEAPRSISLMVSILKSDKMEWVIQKATELGVAEVFPVMTRHGVVKLPTPAKANDKVARWDKISLNALKQSGRLHRMKTHPVSSLEEKIENLEKESCFIGVLDEGETEKTLPEFFSVSVGFEKVIVVIGPEGGWHEDERLWFDQCGITRISLGKEILRAETASLIVASYSKISWGY